MEPDGVLERYRPLFQPRSIAVVGASDNPFKLGFQSLLAVRTAGFPGEIYAVNPSSGPQIQGIAAYRSISELPQGVDLFVFAIPDNLIIPSVKESVARGGRAGVIFAGGFRESGAEGVRRQRELVEAADRGGMKLIGPNCIGMLNTHSRVNATFMAALAYMQPGTISVVSQSGGVGGCILSQTVDELVNIGKFVSIGNRANVEFADMLEYLSADPETSVICLFVEGFDDARDFLVRARTASGSKPVIVCNLGYTEHSSITALSHTGSHASSEAVYSGAFAQAGILRADSIEQMVMAAKSFSMGAALRGNGVFLSTHTAGPAIVITDFCERRGVRFPELKPETAQRITGFLPPHSSPANPLDMFAFAWTDASLYLKAADAALAQDDIYCAVAVFQSGMGAGLTFPAQEYAEIGRRHGKPVFLCLTAPAAFAQEMAGIQAEGVVTFNRAEKTASALVALTRHHLLMESTHNK
jgi:acyl-CoA synthetase (NDP forming)